MLGAASVGIVGLMGLAHLPVARPLLLALSGESCPVGMDKVLSAEQQVAARETSVAPLRGAEPARSRPAFGFKLDETSRTDIKTWASSHNVTCTEMGVMFNCTGLPPGAMEFPLSFDSASFQFDSQERLVGITVRQSDVSAEVALRQLSDTAASLSESVGPVTSERGQTSAEWLGKGMLSQRSSELRYSDYRAQITATNVGQGRVVFRMVVQSLSPRA